VGAGTASPDGREETVVFYDADAGELVFDATRSGASGRRRVELAPFSLKPGEPLDLRACVDKSVIEVYANDRQAICRRVFPEAGSLGLALFARESWGLTRDADPMPLLGNTDDDLPMHYVSWFEAMEFCRRLTSRARMTGALPAGYEYRLPTEAEWEYACRAGSADATYAGPIQIVGQFNAPVLDAIAWYGGNSSVGYQGKGWDTKNWREKQYPGGLAGVRDVGLKRPNPLGLCDMLGDLFLWCRVWYGPYPGGTVTDPGGPNSGVDRVVRGGGWYCTASRCRCAYRDWDVPGLRSGHVGFRVALAPIYGFKTP
jgi:formylglycine-generating enzyme required for sulfatase activity